ncbi:unnamed protein product [Hyaloperonospora brassicae]|uniref:Uncharacterized protein n=1 Tax=Hyaloperonospora brassicae TaxID=162125 RepID=A0AAV0TF69_HYABA|nr:unnamed protein product [Hyaloperonospora brassicae]
MDHLLNGSSTTSFPDDSPDDAAHVGAIKHEATSPTETLFVSVPPQTLPHLATRLVHAGVSPNSSAASLGLHMLSSSAAAPSFLTAHRVSSPPLASTARTAPSRPRLPPISLLTAAAATLQQPPLHCYAVDPLASTAGSVEPPYPLRPFMTPPSYATPAPSSSPSGVAAVPQSSDGRPQADDMLCRYRNKKCGYPRAIKRNGERHNLCEHHRAKANQNQRKLESKRRVKKRMVADRVGKEKKGLVVSPEFKLTLYGDAFA